MTYREYLERGLEKLAAQLDVEFRYTTAKYSFEYGLPRENALKHFFRSYFPERYAFGSGYLVDINGSVSSQSDWIIYDRTFFSPLIAKMLPSDSVEFHPFDSAYAVVEVKSTLNSKTLPAAIRQLADTKRLRRRPTSPGNVHPLLDLTTRLGGDLQQIHTNAFFAGIYAYSENGLDSHKRIFEALNGDVEFELLPDFIAVHGRYYVTKVQNCSAPDVGEDYYRFTHLPQQFNGFGCIRSGQKTSAVFAIRLLNQINNIFLNAYDHNMAVEAVAADFPIDGGYLFPGRSTQRYDKPIQNG
jgi:hypothetical protein